MATEFYTSAHRFKNKILWRGYNVRGERIAHDAVYEPTLWVPKSDGASGFKTLDGNHPTAAKRFDSIYKADSFLEEMSQHHGARVYGSRDWVCAFLNERFPETEPDNKLIRKTYMDIEVNTEGGYGTYEDPWQFVTAITVSNGSRFYSLGLKPYKPCSPAEQYVQCDNEIELLTKFLLLWNELDADVVTGWNTNGYDLPYLIARIDRVLGEGQSSRLSPWNIPPQVRESRNFRGMKTLSASIPGIECIDYLDLYRNVKFVQNQREEYSLDFIANLELDEGKVNYQDEYGTLDNLYKRNPQLYMEYNIRDVRLVRDLDERLKFMDVLIAMAYDARVPYSIATGSVRLWECIIHNYLLKDHVVIPVKPKNNEHRRCSIVGAYVKETKPSAYKWVVTIDASSLYPSLIRQLNISPETFQGKMFRLNSPDKFDDSWDKALQVATDNSLTIASNGAAFSRNDYGVLPELMKLYYEKKEEFGARAVEIERQIQVENDPVKVDKLKHELGVVKTQRSVTKLALNSCYGATNNQYFLFFNPDIGEAITLSGQTLIRRMANCTNEYLNKIFGTGSYDYIIASDTDSIIVDLNRLVQDMVTRKIVDVNDTNKIITLIDKFCSNNLQKVIDAGLDDLAKRTNAMEKAIRMDREVIADRAVWVASKNYMMRVLNMKGVTYRVPKFKIMGLAVVRSSTPHICRKALNEAVKLILDGNQKALLKLIEEFRKEHKQADPADIGKNTKVSRLAYYSRNSDRMPKQVRAALTYNKLIKDKHLENRYALIEEGSKIRMVDLKMPNPVKTHAIGFPSGILPKEFGIHAYIDHEGMLETTFLNPIKSMAKAARIDLESHATLDDFFV